LGLSAGERFGRYIIGAALGTGGMGEVYRAADDRLGREIAIKVLSPSLAEDAEFLHRFRREARTASALNHPNIITIHEIGEADGRHYLAMELIDGETLQERMARGKLPLKETLRIATQVADGLAKAHAAGIVHRDLKPANIMITRDGFAKILDFGLAKVAAPEQLSPVAAATEGPQTKAGIIVGTVGYMSPEQSEARPLDHRSDQFSFGSILYEMVTGARAFDRTTAIRTIMAILDEEPPPIADRAPDTPEPLCVVIEKCLAKRPRDRYEDTALLAAQLHALRELLSDESSATILRRISTASVRRRRRRGRVALLGVAAVIAGFLVWRLLSPAASPPLTYGAARALISSERQLSGLDLSPDGKTLVYAAETGDGVDLFIRRVAGGRESNLTGAEDPLADEFAPDFSPDGDLIAFVRHHPRERRTEICTISSGGGPIRLVLPQATEPTWSPDGRRLAFLKVLEDGHRALATAKPDGTDQKTLLRADAQYPFFEQSAWSPDGRTIAVVRGRGGVAKEVWLVPAGGGDARRLDTGDYMTDDPVFTPDGRALICTSNRFGPTNLWLFPLDGGDPEQLTRGTGPDELPSIARDGSLVWLNARWRYHLRLHDLASGEVRELHRHAAFVWGPAFSPDGKQVAFSRCEQEGDWHVWTVPVAGGEARKLTASAHREIYPRFTPDGHAITYFTWSQTERDRLWQVPVGGGPPEALRPEPDADEGYAEFSPDMKTLAFARAEGGAEHVYLAPSVATGDAHRLTDSPSTLPRWSPDGAWIAFAADRGYSGGISLVRPDGTGERRITDYGGWPVWWPDGESVGYLFVDGRGRLAIERVPVGGGPAERIEGIEFVGTNHPFDVSPDGASLVTTNTVHFVSEIWLMQPAGAAR